MLAPVELSPGWSRSRRTPSWIDSEPNECLEKDRDAVDRKTSWSFTGSFKGSFKGAAVLKIFTHQWNHFLKFCSAGRSVTRTRISTIIRSKQISHSTQDCLDWVSVLLFSCCFLEKECSLSLCLWMSVKLLQTRFWIKNKTVITFGLSEKFCFVLLSKFYTPK